MCRAVVFSILFLVSAATAQLHARHLVSHATSTHVLMTKSGERIRAAVEKLDGDRVVLRVEIGGGHAAETRSIKDFDLESEYMIYEATTPQTADAYLALAQNAAEAGVIDSAKRCLARARDLADDTSIGSDAATKIHGAQVDHFTSVFEGDISRGDVASARRVLATMEYTQPGQYSADKVKAMQAEIDGVIQQHEAAYQADRAKEIAAEEVARRKRIVRPLEELIDAAEANHTKAMKARPGSSDAGEAFNLSVNEAEKALKASQALAKRNAGDDQVLAMLATLEGRAQSIYSTAMFDSASRLIAHGQLNKALGYVNRILSYNPNDRQAMAMRARIEISANSRRW